MQRLVIIYERITLPLYLSDMVKRMLPVFCREHPFLFISDYFIYLQGSQTYYLYQSVYFTKQMNRKELLKLL